MSNIQLTQEDTELVLGLVEMALQRGAVRADDLEFVTFTRKRYLELREAIIKEKEASDQKPVTKDSK